MESSTSLTVIVSLSANRISGIKDSIFSAEKNILAQETTQSLPEHCFIFEPQRHQDVEAQREIYLAKQRRRLFCTAKAGGLEGTLRTFTEIAMLPEPV
jgi:hypothetical protein